MKVMLWNIMRENSPPFGVTKSEDRLFRNMIQIAAKQGLDLQIERMQRSANEIFGSVLVSWIFGYKRKGAEIVHATYQEIAPVIYIRKPKKFIVTVYDLIPLVYPPTNIFMRIQWFFTPKALKKVDKIIAISEFTKKELIRILGIKGEKISVVHLGVDHSEYYPRDKLECKKQLNLNPKEKHILVVANNLKHKRMELTKAVFEKIRDIRGDVKLIKAGYAQALEGERVINIGWIPDDRMPILYNAADVFLHTSEYEGFGLPILEAMACGIPVVTSNKASIPEIVGDAGETIDLDSEDVVEQFTEKVLESIEKGSDQKALERSMEFSWERNTKETIRIYEEVLNAVSRR